MQTIADAICLAEQLLGQPAITAVYPCSGYDTKPFTYLHPDFLAHRNASRCPAPSLFVYIDKNPVPDGQLGFDDGQTRIAMKEIRKVRLQGVSAMIGLLSQQFVDSPDWCRTPARDIAVLYLQADWENAVGCFRAQEFVPDLIIGVSDGCRFGDNDHCVNHLTTGVDGELARPTRVPKYWVTDHFGNAETPNPLEVGGTIRSRNQHFPYAFKKVELLSSQWGHYGNGPIGGATLFEVVEEAQDERGLDKKTEEERG